MTTADKYEFPQGDPLFNTTWRAVSDANDGNGILNSDDFRLNHISGTMRTEVLSGDLWYDSKYHSYGGGFDHEHSAGDAENDRWDTVYYDTDTKTPAVREGIPEPNPEPPDIGADEFLLGYVYVPQGATELTDDYLKNWRSHAQRAENTRLNDAEDYYDATEVEEAFREAFEIFVNVGGDVLNGPLDLSEFDGSAPFDLGENPTGFGSIVDAIVDGGSPQGTEHSYEFALDGETFVRIYAESDGAGGVENARVELVPTTHVESDLETAENIRTTAGTVIWDSVEGHVPQEQLAGPASELSDYPLLLGEDTDRDLGGRDLNDGETTVYDAEDARVPREQVERRLLSTEINETDSPYLVENEEVVYVDTTGGEVTVQLGSALVDDPGRSNQVSVVDAHGNASENIITVETETTENIDGLNETVIEVDYGGLQFSEDGNNWITSGGTALGVDPTDQIEGAESGEVTNGNQGVLITDHLLENESIRLHKAIFHLATGEPAPTDLNLTIATLDNSGGYQSRETIYSGDGSTVWDGAENSVGDPLAEWKNDTGAPTTVAVLVDNGTAETQAILAKVTGVRD